MLALTAYISVVNADDFIDSARTASSAGVTAYTSMLSNAPAALARSYVAGSTNTKGIVGESLAAKKFLQTTLKKTGNWHAISPRVGRTGIDHIFLKINPDTGLPKGLIVGESKYASSRLGNTKDGLQLTSKWIKPRLRAMGNRYFQLSDVTTIKKAPILGGNHEMKIVLKNGKEVCFWRNNSKDSWKFSGNRRELAEAQKLAKSYGQYLTAVGDGKILYRSRLFQITPKGDDIIITIKDASKLDTLRSASKLPAEGDPIILRNALKKRVSKDVGREIAKGLKEKIPGLNDKEVVELVKVITSNNELLNPYGNLQVFGTYALNAGIASLTAVALDAGLQLIQKGDIKEIDGAKLALTGGAVFVGTLGSQYLTQQAVKLGMFTTLSKTLGCSATLLSSSLSSATSIFVIGSIISYGSWLMGYTDLETANRTTIATGIGTGLGVAAGWGTLAAISTWGTASTGTAIATLSGAAATNATLAFLGGGTVAMGATVLTGGIALIAVAGTGAVMFVYHIIDQKQEFARITKLCELFSRPEAIDMMLRNSSVPVR